VKHLLLVSLLAIVGFSVSAHAQAGLVMLGVGGPAGPPTTNLKVWYRGDSLTCTGGCSGTNVVTALVDKSANGNNCTTSGGPTYLASGPPHFPGITFASGSSQYCAMGTPVAWNGTTNGITLFVIAADANISSSQGFMGCSIGCFNLNFTNTGYVRAAIIGIATLGTETTPTTNGVYHLWTVVYNSSTGVLSFWRDGVSDGGATDATTVTSALAWIARTNVYGSVGFSELLVYDTNLDGTTISAINTAIMSGSY